MLVNFRFKNCRSFYEEATLSMKATADTDLREINTFTVDGTALPQGDNELLKSAVIFGANASGKTNVLRALGYMRTVVLGSASQTPFTRINEPFAFYSHAFEKESLYEVELIQNGVFYKYGFTIQYGEIKKEWLFKRIERLTEVISREDGRIRIPTEGADATKFIALNGNTLFLSQSFGLNLKIKEHLAAVMTWFIRLFVLFENDANSLDIYTVDGGKYKKQAVEILKLADIGIQNMEIRKDKIANVSADQVLSKVSLLQADPSRGQITREADTLYDTDVVTQFPVYNEDKTLQRIQDIYLYKNRGFNSSGTERLICYLGCMLAALDKGTVLLIDEIDSKLHFLVVNYLLRLFNSIDKNPKNAQLVCAAHNLMLMDEGLRRDQIYFTGKNETGESTLISLSDFKNVRKTDLFSKKYLAGFYSALPNMKRDD